MSTKYNMIHYLRDTFRVILERDAGIRRQVV
jgi:hypothetical protein